MPLCVVAVHTVLCGLHSFTEMQMLRYLQYFWYHARHWNPALAAFVLKHELRGEKKYGINTMSISEITSDIDETDAEHSNHYHPVNYWLAEQLLAQITHEQKQNAFLEVGCGKGRVMAMAAAYGFREIIGLEISETLIHEAVAVLQPIQEKYPDSNLSFDCENASFYEVPHDVGVVFMFNPFDEVVMEDFAEQLLDSLLQQPREMTILYASPEHKTVFTERGFVETFHVQKHRWIEGVVLQYHPPKN